MTRFLSLALVVAGTSPAVAQAPRAAVDAVLPGGQRAALTLDDGQAFVTVTRGGRAALVYPIATPNQALAVLADRDLAAIWPALLDWAGPDLELLRQRTLGRAEQRYRDDAGDARVTAESSVRPKTRALMIYASELSTLGHVDAAWRLVEDARAKAAADDSDWGPPEWTMLGVRAMTLMRLREGNARTIDFLRDLAATGRERDYNINFDANRAALLAEAGRYDEALALIDRAQAAFDAPDPKAPHDLSRIRGSDRQFNWIRACALHGLGRTAEAERLAAKVGVGPEPYDADFVISPNAELRYRLFVCMHDARRAADVLADQLERSTIGSAVLLRLQPLRQGPGVDPAMVARIAAEPRLKAMLDRRMRTLSGPFEPALREWRRTP